MQGVRLYRGHNYQEAIGYFKAGLKIAPDNAKAHYFLGSIYGKLGRYNDAMEPLKQAIRINPNFAVAHHNLGGTYLALEKYKEAIKSFKQAISLKPDLAEAHFGLGIAYSLRGSYKKAIVAYKQAIRLKPNLAEAHSSLRQAYLTITSEVVQELANIRTLEMAYDADYREYGSLASIGWVMPRGKTGYKYSLSYSPTTFLATARGNIDGDATIDEWNIDENNLLVHSTDDLRN